MKMIESVYLNFSAYVFHINTNLSNSHASSASAESPLIGDNKLVLVALTDKFNALFHHGNFPVG